MKDIYRVLEDLEIPFEKYEHPAVFTVEEAAQIDRGIDAGKSKNLFLRNKKGTTLYLVVVEAHKKVDLKLLSQKLLESKLSFGSPERLFEILQLTPGSVSPFGLINDNEHLVDVIIDNDLLKHPKVSFHPNINTATLAITTNDFKKYLESLGNKIKYFEL